MLGTNCLFLLARADDGADLQRTLQNIKTDAAQLVNIWVVDLGEKSNLRRGHRIVVW